MTETYDLISFNQQYYARADFNPGLENRGFKYGDGFFETMHANGLQTQFIQSHYERILKAVSILQMQLPEYFTVNFFEKQVAGLLSRKKLFQAARVKAIFIRSGSGLYHPETNTTDILIEAVYAGKGPYEINEEGITLGIYSDYAKPKLPYMQIKSMNAQFYVNASIFAAENGFNDVLLVDAQGYLLEATSSNLFCVRGKTLLTPDIQLGGVHGVMRKQLIEIARTIGFEVDDQAHLLPDDLLQMDEVFLTNAAVGIKYVSGYKDRRFFKRASTKLLAALNEVAFG